MMIRVFRILQRWRVVLGNGEIYRLRKLNGVIEHWVYFSCQLLQWEAFDPIRHRWMHLPRMPHYECSNFSDKESLVVGTELLVFGKEVASQRLPFRIFQHPHVLLYPFVTLAISYLRQPHAIAGL
ncbi:hypothetical protein V6N11_070344 [Hibiscus sabdariffa]|uniref:Uncharacterized protein n=1 Tax=Hibiscus sabdariffa TaxID=183260 RepID=A0ABR2QF64_9ROSI